MIRIAISQAAFDAIVATMELGNVGFKNKTDEQGRRLIWLPHAALAKLNHLRGPGGSYSDAMLRLAAEGAS